MWLLPFRLGWMVHPQIFNNVYNINKTYRTIDYNSWTDNNNDCLKLRIISQIDYHTPQTPKKSSVRIVCSEILVYALVRQFLDIFADNAQYLYFIFYEFIIMLSDALLSTEITYQGLVDMYIWNNPCLNNWMLILGFRCDVDEICAPLGYYATSCGNCLETFRDYMSVPEKRRSQTDCS